MRIRRYSYVVKSVFKYILIISDPHNFAPGVKRVVLISIFSVDRSTVDVPTSQSSSILPPTTVMRTQRGQVCAV